MRRSRPGSLARLVLLWALSGAAIWGLPALAQGAGDQEPGDQGPGDPAIEEEAAAGSFFAAVDVEIVNIDVWVTDGEGRPVEGLGKDDFVVLRDGRPVEIANFYAVYGGRPEPAGAPAPAPAGASPEGEELAEPEPAPPARSPALAPEHRLWLIVYVDNSNLDPIERNRVLPGLKLFLGRTLSPGDRAMVVTYARSLEVRQPFTDQLTLLEASLDELIGEAGYATIRRREQFSILKLIDDADDSLQALGYARSYAEAQMDDVERTVEALQELVDTLAGLPGRKALLHVSSGVPMLAGEEMFHAVAEKFGTSEAYVEIPRHDTTRRFESLSRHAAARRVTLNTLDAGGLRGFEFGAAEYGGFVNMSLRSTLDSVVPENLQSPLRLMALETGGRAILNRNEVLPALDEMAEDFRSFYSLGISSSDAESGRYHEIEVKLRERRRGVRVRHRTGYRSKSLDTRMRESLQSALLYAHQSNPLDVEVRWGRARRHGDDGRYLLPIQLRVPLREVVLLPVGKDKHEARFRLYVGAIAGGSRTSEIDDAPFGVRLANEHVEAARRESLLHTHKLLLAPGRKKVGVAVLDLFGSQSSVVTAIVDVGPVAKDPAAAGQGGR